MSLEQNILVEVIDSISSILPFQVEEAKTKELIPSSDCITVQIETVGDYQSTIVLKGDNRFFNEIGKTMYGMELEGMMLESFASELWNMILGGIMVNATQQGVDVDITPATLNGELHDTEAIYHLDVFQGEKIGVLTVFVSP